MEDKACERDVELGILRCQVNQLVGEQKSIRERVRANERVVAIVSALGIGAGGIIGTAAFAPKANAIPSIDTNGACLLYTSPSPRDRQKSRMPSSA